MVSDRLERAHDQVRALATETTPDQPIDLGGHVRVLSDALDVIVAELNDLAGAVPSPR